MRNLMVCDRKGGGLRNIEELASILEANLEQARCPQRAIDVDRGRDRRDAVFGQDDNPGVLVFRVVNQVARDRVDLGEALADAHVVRPETLQVII
jgi:hypothetical protein